MTAMKHTIKYVCIVTVEQAWPAKNAMSGWDSITGSLAL